MVVKQTIPKPPLLKLTASQLVILLLAATIALPAGYKVSLSLLLGGLIQLVGSAYFAWVAFRYRGASQVRQSVQSMYRGETGKLVLTATLFAIVFIAARALVDVAALFVGFVVMVVVHTTLLAGILKPRKP